VARPDDRRMGTPPTAQEGTDGIIRSGRVHDRAMAGILITVGVLGGCSGGGHDDGHHDEGHDRSGGCLLVGEQEPNATALTAQFLGDPFIGDCAIVAGSLFDPADVDSYRVLVQEDFTLVVTLDHSPLVDFDIQLFHADTGELIRACGISVVPEICVVSFVVRAGGIVVDVVVTSAIDAGTYTLTIDTQ
jgi:hypothetical protein